MVSPHLRIELFRTEEKYHSGSSHSTSVGDESGTSLDVSDFDEKVDALATSDEVLETAHEPGLVSAGKNWNLHTPWLIKTVKHANSLLFLFVTCHKLVAQWINALHFSTTEDARSQEAMQRTEEHLVPPQNGFQLAPASYVRLCGSHRLPLALSNKVLFQPCFDFFHMVALRFLPTMIFWNSLRHAWIHQNRWENHQMRHVAFRSACQPKIASTDPRLNLGYLHLLWGSCDRKDHVRMWSGRFSVPWVSIGPWFQTISYRESQPILDGGMNISP